MYLDKKTIVESLTDEDIIKIAIELGSEYPRIDSQGNFIFQTNICHGGDSWKLYYYKETKKFHCYTCGDGYDIINLVIRANKSKGRTVTWYNALKFIGITTNKLVTTEKEKIDQNTIIDDWSWLNQFNKKRVRELPELKEYNEHVLELFNYSPNETWTSEGISKEVLSEFEIGYYTLQNCITIPVRDINGRFIGLRGRYMLEQDILLGKYRPMNLSSETLKFNTGTTFYGLYQNQAAIKKNKRAYIFEAEKSVLLNHTYFGDNDLSLCTFGSNLTDTQVKILLKVLNVTHIIICFDKEYHKSDSYEATIYYHKLLKKLQPYMRFFTIELVMDRKGLLDYKDSPVDKGKEVWLELLEDKFEVTMEDIKLLEQKEEE